MMHPERFVLRLPRSLKKAVARVSREERVSVNQFITIALAEKVSALDLAEYFAKDRKRIDWKAFDKLISRKDGRPPRKGDEMPALAPAIQPTEASPTTPES